MGVETDQWESGKRGSFWCLKFVTDVSSGTKFDEGPSPEEETIDGGDGSAAGERERERERERFFGPLTITPSPFLVRWRH